MKQIALKFSLIILLNFSFCLKAKSQKDFIFSIKTGLPIIESANWESFSYSLDASMLKKLAKNSFAGIEIGYLKNDVNPRTNIFTFDNEVFNASILSMYTISIGKSMTILPEVQVGYAFYSNQLNEIETKKENGNGLLIGGGMNILIPIRPRISLNANLRYCAILKQQGINTNISVPTNYINIPENIKIWKIGIGVQFEL